MIKASCIEIFPYALLSNIFSLQYIETYMSYNFYTKTKKSRINY